MKPRIWFVSMILLTAIVVLHLFTPALQKVLNPTVDQKNVTVRHQSFPNNETRISANNSHPYCTKFIGQSLPPKTHTDVSNYTSIFHSPQVIQDLFQGKFPNTVFTPHIESILKVISSDDEIEARCKPTIIRVNVNAPFSTSVQVEIINTDDDLNVVFKWWREALQNMFSRKKNMKTIQVPVLPTNVSLSISVKDYNKRWGCHSKKKTRFDRLANSAPNGTFAVDNFLEVQRWSKRVVYPILPWEERCAKPIWRGSLWLFQKTNNLTTAMNHYPRRINAVAMSHARPDLLDAKSSNIGGVVDSNLWKENVTNGFWKLLPEHSIPSEQYYSHYQTVLVLCGIGSAFRTPIHLSTATAVLLQFCEGKEEWYHPYMVPWEHYIPLDGELTHLEERLEWVRDHPDEVYLIAQNGRKFYETYLSFERKNEHYYELLYRMALKNLKSPELQEELTPTSAHKNVTVRHQRD